MQFAILFQSTPPVWAETVKLFIILLRHHDFNPLRPCGRRLVFCAWYLFILEFQSTPPVWAETYVNGLCHPVIVYFNPLRPCGRRLHTQPAILLLARFQSTPPVWAETFCPHMFAFGLNPISIHSARVGGDRQRRLSLTWKSNFNPLRPCGRRLG